MNLNQINIYKLDEILKPVGITRTAFVDDFIKSYITLYEERETLETVECGECGTIFRGLANCPTCD